MANDHQRTIYLFNQPSLAFIVLTVKFTVLV